MPIHKKDKNGKIILTAKEAIFCREYSICRNGAKSAVKAGYSPKTAVFIANENLSKPYIQEQIEVWNADFNKLMELEGITKANIVREHAKMAFTSIAHLHNTWIERKEFEALSEDQKACIKEIDTKIEYKVFNEDGKKGKRKIEFIKISLFDKQKSLDSISKIMGFDAPVKQELSGNIVWHEELTVSSDKKE